MYWCFWKYFISSFFKERAAASEKTVKRKKCATAPKGKCAAAS